MRLSKLLSYLIGMVPLLVATAACACPFCDTYTGQRVREGIWDEHFWHNVLLTALPFAVFAVIIALLHFGVPFTRRARDSSVTGTLV